MSKNLFNRKIFLHSNHKNETNLFKVNQNIQCIFRTINNVRLYAIYKMINYSLIKNLKFRTRTHKTAGTAVAQWLKCCAKIGRSLGRF